MRRLLPITAVLVFLSALFGTTTATADEDAMIFHPWYNAKDNYARCMAVSGGVMANGTKVIQWPCNPNSPEHYWSRIPLLTDNGYYLIRNKKNPNFCLSVPNNWISPNVQLTIWTCQNAPGQLWDARYYDEHGYEIYNKKSGLVIDIYKLSTDNGAAVVQAERNDWFTQNWNDVPHKN
jgi:hypothetical protein